MAHSNFFTGTLYQRMTEDLHLAGMSERTHAGYLRAVRKLADYCQTAPDKITEDQLRRFFLHMKNELNYAYGTLRVAFSGIKFFYTRTCKRDWLTLQQMRQHAPAYLDKFGEDVPSGHRKVISLITRCRTGQLGGVAFRCDDCGHAHWFGRSCGNRHCPGCGQEKTTDWLAKQTKRLMPVHHFLVTFTVPDRIGAVLRSSQREGYSALFDAGAASIRVYKAKPADELRACGLYDAVPAIAWKGKFVVDVKPVGDGNTFLRHDPTRKILETDGQSLAPHPSATVTSQHNPHYRIRRW